METTAATGAPLTARQQREQEFFDTFSRLAEPVEVGFDPVAGRERRPWNPYWYVYHFLADHITRQGQPVLNIGCGNGAESVRLARLGCEVWGLDISPRNIEIARRLASQYGCDDRTHFSVQPVEQLDFPDGTFEFVVGFDILHHVEIEPAIREAMRVLKPGGTAIFKEHIEVPPLDRIRNTRLLTRLVSRDKCFDRDRPITDDERKLTADDLAIMRRCCSRLTVRRFTFMSRLDMFLRRADNPRSSLLERFDHALFKACPPLSTLGGGAVLILEKSA